MMKIFSRGLLFVVPLWLFGSIVFATYTFVVRATHPVTSLLIHNDLVSKHEHLVKFAEFIVVMIFVLLIGLFLTHPLIKRLVRAIMVRIPFIGKVLEGYFRVEDSLTGVSGENRIVLVKDEDEFHWLGLKTGEIEGKVIVYIPSFPAFSGSVVLIPPDRILPTSITFSEMMSIYTTLGITHKKKLNFSNDDIL